MLVSKVDLETFRLRCPADFTLKYIASNTYALHKAFMQRAELCVAFRANAVLYIDAAEETTAHMISLAFPPDQHLRVLLGRKLQAALPTNTKVMHTSKTQMWCTRAYTQHLSTCNKDDSYSQAYTVVYEVVYFWNIEEFIEKKFRYFVGFIDNDK